MKTIRFMIFALLGCGIASGHEQSKHFRAAYEARGDSFMEALYWLPETRETFRKHITNHDQWVGFESGYWKDVPPESRLKILDELGARWDMLDSDTVNLGWERINRWELVAKQLRLMRFFIDGEEQFFEWGFDDELLRPAFGWLIERRPKDFSTKHIGASFSSGETVHFRSVLIQHFLESTEEEQFSCFSRFYAHLAATQNKRAESGRNGD